MTANNVRLLSLPCAKLSADPRCQMRIDEDAGEEVAQDYAEVLKAGGQLCGRSGREFPVAFWDGKTYWLADGFRRRRAHELAGRKSMEVEVHDGSFRDAVLWACGANALHGMRRKREDLRRAVWTLLEDEEWGKWSAREIARQCGVSNTFVGVMRAEHQEHLSTLTDRKCQRGGTTYTQKARKPAELTPEEQLADADARERSTARDLAIEHIHEAGIVLEVWGDDALAARDAVAATEQLVAQLKVETERLAGRAVA